MTRYLTRRFLHGVVTLVALSVISFLLVRLAPGDASDLIGGTQASPEQRAAIRESLGLNQPLITQYWNYLSNVVRGDFGTTIVGSSPIGPLLANAAVPTLWLAGASIIMTLVIAITLGILASRRPGGFVDVISGGLTVAGMAMPSFWIGIMLVVFIALPTGLFPIGGWPADTGARLNAIILPAFALSLTIIPVLLKSLRSSLISIGDSDYVHVSRSLGNQGFGLLTKTLFRNAVIPMIPLAASMMAYLFGGTVIIETTFGLPGLGQMLVQGTKSRDANIVLGVVLIIGVLVVLSNIVADVVRGLLDPRVRLA
ncbi:ABC transporter permease [Subtercola boreus]|nr:ABC transporter permease [Subtercola boreus]TQL54870.1 peptide/nickel transport system permease protein [Subtercola boreus]